MRFQIANMNVRGKAVRAQITEAQKIVSGSGSEQDIAEAKIELEVCSPSPKMFRMIGKA